jgi:hypothetical protein
MDATDCRCLLNKGHKHYLCNYCVHEYTQHLIYTRDDVESSVVNRSSYYIDNAEKSKNSSFINNDKVNNDNSKQSVKQSSSNNAKNKSTNKKLFK